MKNMQRIAIGLVGILLLSAAARGEEPARYRGFALGSSVESVVTATGVSAAQVRTLHQRPSLLQEIEWRPSRWMRGSSVVTNDPVDTIRFSFHEGRLFRMVITYSRERTAGLTTSDLIESISSVYGPPVSPVLRSRQVGARVPPGASAESAGPVAHWGDGAYSVALTLASSYGESWELVVAGTEAQALAVQADAAAKRLDEIEAPQRSIDRQLQERERERADAEKSRGVNKPAFKP